MIWYVARNPDKTIAAAFSYEQPDYADEQLDDQAGELAVWFSAVRNPMPAQVTPLQMRMALRQLGILNQVIGYVNQQPPDVQDAWNYASFFPITDPMIVAAARALNVDLNSLFKTAGALHP